MPQSNDADSRTRSTWPLTAQLSPHVTQHVTTKLATKVTHVCEAEDANRPNKRHGPHKEISYLSQGQAIINIINNA